MKKFLLLFILLNNISFASFYMYYKDITIENCTNKLIELNKSYNIKSYKIIPDKFIKYFRADYGEILTYNMIVELEEKI